MEKYGAEFSAVAFAHLLAVASPGPDFAVVLKQSLLHGRRAALWTSVGVGCAISLHVAYTLLGIGFLLKSSPAAFSAVKCAGAAYLVWLGIGALRARPRHGLGAAGPPPAPPSDRAAWTTGFLTNALNPKATLFFLALFTVVVSPSTPRWVQAGYGAWMVAATAAWFSLISVFFTRESVRSAFLRHGHWIDRGMGALLLAFALRLALATRG